MNVWVPLVCAARVPRLVNCRRSGKKSRAMGAVRWLEHQRLNRRRAGIRRVSMGLTFPSIFDPDGRVQSEVFDSFHPATSSTLVIDGNGLVAARILGK